ncbi:hypothetical protein [Microbacterium sp. 179-I 3D4 NHS]|uniref:hypothetical protein n=1 Tax=Microbacterium sp. 179-I 3D4 NHS TaxID=3142381 RepID=UPI00399F3D69
MKLVSYAGQQLITTDDVADALVTLAAAIANEGESDAVEIPIIVDGEEDHADLVVGVGNDVLVGPQHSKGQDPDFSAHAERLRSHPLFPEGQSRSVAVEEEPLEEWDLDLDLEADATRG